MLRPYRAGPAFVAPPATHHRLGDGLLAQGTICFHFHPPLEQPAAADAHIEYHGGAAIGTPDGRHGTRGTQLRRPLRPVWPAGQQATLFPLATPVVVCEVEFAFHAVVQEYGEGGVGQVSWLISARHSLTSSAEIAQRKPTLLKNRKSPSRRAVQQARARSFSQDPPRSTRQPSASNDSRPSLAS